MEQEVLMKLEEVAEMRLCKKGKNKACYNQEGDLIIELAIFYTDEAA